MTHPYLRWVKLNVVFTLWKWHFGLMVDGKSRAQSPSRYTHTHTTHTHTSTVHTHTHTHKDNTTRDNEEIRSGKWKFLWKIRSFILQAAVTFPSDSLQALVNIHCYFVLWHAHQLSTYRSSASRHISHVTGRKMPALQSSNADTFLLWMESSEWQRDSTCYALSKNQRPTPIIQWALVQKLQ